ncbi:mannan endo-1,6-alpha-mannosidase [Tolypocladium capitatum]|uniref:Mannan endo-1,6-alpha-mannosidase n=1 Tax=Tolypocladium capitatum TaxID=45235 RepID=A0A2K3QEL3_9HYPO|nr:mannan endo-1,6-alpha-mannosidase [Tolypocladium capitatum]
MLHRHGGWRGALVAAVCALATPAAAASAQTYVNDAVTAIQTLNNDFYDVSTGLWGNAWWNSANALTTLADFASVRLTEANQLNVGGYMRNTYIQAQNPNAQARRSIVERRMAKRELLQKREPLQKRGFANFINQYYDDEGWWALALIRSHDVAGDRDYLDSAVNIFNDMQTGRGTPCGGGIYWSKDRQYVNAIANELYLTVAASLANRIPQNRTYANIATAQWQWFDRSGMINAQGLINDGLTANCQNNGLQTWSYNQGVILGGLVELSRATGDASYIQRAVNIAQAAIKALANTNGVLVETDQCELKPGNCGGDGAQFKGVFVRNLRYLNTVAPNQAFENFITKNADSIWANDRNNQNMLGVAWTGPYVTATAGSHSSALDVLVAAIAVSN